MHIEFRHLRTIKAIHDTGSVAGAADQLNITQSALSHQIKGIEDQVGLELFARRTKPLRLSAAGLRMLAAAERILPQLDALEAEFEGVIEGRLGRLHVGLDGRASLDWVVPVMDSFRRAWPQIDLDLRTDVAGDPAAALRREEVDLVITADPVEAPETSYLPLFDYEPVFVAAVDHPLAEKSHIEAQDFKGEVLLCHSGDSTKIDVMKTMLAPARIDPKAIREVEVTDMILMLIASGRGVAVIPDWALRHVWRSPDYITRPLTREGITRRMFAAVRSADATVPYVAHLVRLARQEAVRLQRR